MPVWAKTAEEVLAVVNEELFVPVRNVLFALAFIVFLWGVTEFLFAQENEEKKTTGKRHMLWGLVGLFIMFAVNGLIEILVQFVANLK